MIAFLITLVISNEIYIKKTGLEFLDNLVTIDIFSLIFICLNVNYLKVITLQKN